MEFLKIRMQNIKPQLISATSEKIPGKNAELLIMDISR